MQQEQKLAEAMQHLPSDVLWADSSELEGILEFPEGRPWRCKRKFLDP